MIPIRDTIPSRTYPIVNNILIGINIVVFLIEISHGAGMENFIKLYGFVPARYTIPEISQYFTFPQQVISLFTFMFLHGGIWHLVGNMWSLYIFGDNVEDSLGSLRYLVFYILCGLVSGLFHLMFNFYSIIPTIGASGAIAGVMGAYMILFPRSRVLTLIPILFIPYFIEIPAFFFLGFWFLIQIFNVTFSGGAASGIAWWAHIGGFVAGAVIMKVFNVMPSVGFDDRLSKVTEKKRTDRLQVINPIGDSSDPNLYGTIDVTPFEAMNGTTKLVNIPWGFQARLYRINIPPGSYDGMVLRMEGLGKIKPSGARGDLLLKMAVR